MNENMYKSLEAVVAKLREPGGCPWDQKQTHESLRKYLLEETYEAIEAIDEGDMAHLKEELGDVLLQVVFHARLAEEKNLFNLQDVVDGEVEKMLRRHPHVFSNLSVDGEEAVLQNWETIKAKEMGRVQKKSILDGIPRELPALMQTEKLQEKAVKVGFTWPNIEGVKEKFEEELQEFADAVEEADLNHMEDEAGDVLFTFIHLLQWHGISAENALRRANRKFINRFQYMEEQLKKYGKEWENVTLEELDGYWNEKKMIEIDKNSKNSIKIIRKD